MARKPQIGRKAELQVVASPVNTFVSAAPAQRSQLWDLANSLGRFDSELQGFLDKKRGEKDKRDSILGEADFYKNNQMGYAEGVRTGKIPAYASPEYVKAYKAAEGMSVGHKFSMDFEGAYSVWADKDNPDPGAFDRFFNEYASNYIKTKDPDVLAGLLPTFKSSAFAVRERFEKERAQKFYTDTVQAHGASVSSGIDQLMSEGVEGAKKQLRDDRMNPDEAEVAGGVDYDTMWQQALAKRKMATSVGMKEEDFDQQMFRTFAAKALQYGDFHLLEMLDKEIPGTKTKFSDTAEGLKMKMETEQSLLTLAEKRERESSQRLKAEEKARYNQNLGAAFKAFASDPNASVPEDVIADMEKHDPDVRLKLAQGRKTMADASLGVEDPRKVASIYADLMQGGGQKRVLDAYARGEIRDPKTLSELAGFAERFEAAGGAGRFDKVASRTVFKDTVEAIKARTAKAGTSAIGAAMGWGPEGGFTDMGFEVKTDFTNMVGEWLVANPNASLQETDAAIRQISQQVLAGIQQPVGADGSPDMMGQPSYKPPEGAQPSGDNPFRQQAGQEAPPGAVNGQEQQQPQDPWARVPDAEMDAPLPEAWAQENPPQVDALSPEDKAKVNELSKKLGVPPELIIQRAWQINKEIEMNKANNGGKFKRGVPKGTDTSPESLSRAGEITGSIDPVGGEDPASRAEKAAGLLRAVEEDLSSGGMAMGQDKSGGFTNDPNRNLSHSNPRLGGREAQALALLDTIGSKEAPRGYGQIYGGAKGVGSPASVDVSKMTLNQVLELQRTMRSAGSASTAAGRYQFLRKTLVQTMSEMGLTGNEVWTPELQDTMALHLMEGRGLNAFLEGDISAEEFGNNLAKEWASLPVVAGTKKGRSYYAGDGLNKSFHNPDDILKQLVSLQKGNLESDTVITRDGVAKRKAGAGAGVYANIPADELENFRAWNSDPVANEQKTLATVHPSFTDLVDEVRKISGVKFVVASGHRDDEMQKKAVAMGWSKTMDSNHKKGQAIDVWPLDANGAVVFDPVLQEKIGRAFEEAMKRRGIKGQWGGRWKFKDAPHIQIDGNLVS